MFSIKYSEFFGPTIARAITGKGATGGAAHGTLPPASQGQKVGLSWYELDFTINAMTNDNTGAEEGFISGTKVVGASWRSSSIL